ncbi:MAG: TetR/AcrR family transcriptional regulator [Butyricicoccus sp.]|nr:TetR/AcrR family transcriptional regulator [Butyricicoccus sp.]MBQ8584983.1 TetR/AcrR family transcriptional regulator [Butyricicoccus sp.]
MTKNTKRALIEKTYEILKHEGADKLKIRYIADQIGCTSTTIYRHFADLDELVCFASVQFLQEYYKDFRRTMNESKLNILEKNLMLWERFSRYAFENAQVYNMLFWGKYRANLGDIIFQYYEIFEQEDDAFDGFSATILFNSDMRDRELIMERRAAAAGFFDSKDVEVLSDLVTSLFHGILIEYIDRKDPERVEEGTERFMKLLRSAYQKYRKQ